MNLTAYLKQNNVWHKIIEKDSTVHTADAAAATGIQLERVTKSLVFLADNSPILVIIPGNCRVDKGKLKAAINAKDVEIVSFEKVEEYWAILLGQHLLFATGKLKKLSSMKR